MMCRRNARIVLLGTGHQYFSCQQHGEAAYSPAIVRIDTGSSYGPFTDAGGNVWSSRQQQ